MDQLYVSWSNVFKIHFIWIPKYFAAMLNYINNYINNFINNYNH